MEYQDILKEINESVNNLLKQYKQLFTKEEVLFMKKLQFQAKKHNFTSYEEIKNYEIHFRPFFARVWALELTDPNDFKVGNNFKFVITCPTVAASKFSLDNKHFVSASLITEKHLGTFNKINYGLICNVDENNLMSISADDSNTICESSSDDFHSKKYFYTATTQSGRKLYNKKYINSLKLPNQIGLEMVKKNIVENGDFIVQKNKQVYSDITLDPHSTKFLGVVLFEPYTQHDYEEAHVLAEKFNLKIYSIPTDLYHDKISIAHVVKEQHIYNISDLNTIEYILKHYTDLMQEYSNLMFNYIGDSIIIKDSNGIGKLSINTSLQDMIIIINDDTRYFKIDFSKNLDNNYFYQIDSDLVDRKTFETELKSSMKDNIAEDKYIK